MDNTVQKCLLQTHNIRKDLKPLKLSGRCKVFLAFDRRAAVAVITIRGFMITENQRNELKPIKFRLAGVISNVTQHLFHNNSNYENCSSVTHLDCT